MDNQNQNQNQKNQIFDELYQSYADEILYLRKEGSKLLRKIKLQEIKMNQRRQRQLEPLLRQLTALDRMANDLIKISAFIDTYKYFQLIKITLFDNIEFFYQLANFYYEDAQKKIILKLKRINQLRGNHDIDFNIDL